MQIRGVGICGFFASTVDYPWFSRLGETLVARQIGFDRRKQPSFNPEPAATVAVPPAVAAGSGLNDQTYRSNQFARLLVHLGGKIRKIDRRVNRKRRAAREGEAKL
jgi:hypothetical protein